MCLDLRLVNLVIIDMEKDTVILSLVDYNKLREFKEKVEQDYVVEKVYWYGQDSYKYFTKDSAIKTIIEDFNNKKKHFDELVVKLKESEDALYELKKLVPNKPIKKDPTLEDIKKMSYWEFRKWKKSN